MKATSRLRAVLAIGGMVVAAFAIRGPEDAGFLAGAKLVVLPIENGSVEAVSPNGKYVGGEQTGGVPFVWSMAKGLKRVTGLPTCYKSAVSVVLDNGTAFGWCLLGVDASESSRWFAWTPSRGVKVFGIGRGYAATFCPATATPDGKIIAGSVATGKNRRRAATYDDRNGVRLLSLPDPATQSCWPNSVSANGKVVVGEAFVNYERRAVRWEAGRAVFITLEREPWMAPEARASSVSSDGSKVVVDHSGGCYVWSSGKRVTVYEPANRGPQANVTGRMPAFDLVKSGAATGDGSTVFGTKIGGVRGEAKEAFVWTAKYGFNSVSALLALAKIDIPAGLALAYGVGMSRDGKVLAGTALKGDSSRAYILIRP